MANDHAPLLDGKNVGIPLLVVVSGGFALAAFVWTVNTQIAEWRLETKDQINEVKQEVSAVRAVLEASITQTNTRLTRIEVEMEKRTADRYTRTEHERWCRTTELVNQNNGWKCPNLDHSERLEYAPRLQGWDGTTGSNKR